MIQVGSKWPIVLSFVFFYLLSRYLSTRAKPKRIDPKRYGLYENLQVSMIHSLLSGVGACLALSDPQIWDDLIHYYSPFGSKIVKMSTGYFLYDFYHVLSINDFKFAECWELVAHHIAVLSCIGTSGFFDYYHGFSCIALVMEVNTVFLHVRSLLKMGRKCESNFYKINSWINLVTIVLFRIIVAFAMLYLFQTHYERQAYWEYCICNIGVSVVQIMNFFLLYRSFSFDRQFILRKAS
ncbi:Oidioi.mRNA.OKI2018_I69.chr2.g5599.t1.cds [Oikopleura dioica]|uniref:Oidioi.mRNA.OKI2018_I69.chr2.g5599.t1.cds n=1 Tax=Oikopleura dioica TaxID=34765 RepID=A0ABN7T551_OIKDI|nr:Oidioi.mRNA.OKI2018_I69.chr2.g5599.t1.cds [Oikopleura dioica]